LRCQFIIGGADGESDRDRDDASGASMTEVPHFDAISDRIRAAYESEDETRIADDLNPHLSGERLVYSAVPAAFDDENLVRLAADSSDRERVAQIPSFHAEGGKVVVTFRVDSVAATVSAHFIAADFAAVQHRPLLIGDRVFVGDADGSVALEGISPDEALGFSVALPSLLNEWTIAPPPPIAGHENSATSLLELGRGDVRFPYGSASYLLTRRDVLTGGFELRVRFEGPLNDSRGVVVVGDKEAALITNSGSARTFAFDLGDALPKTLRIRFYAVV